MTLALFPYQQEGAAFLAGRDRAGLFDEMGVGKTAQAIGALDRIDATRIVIVCPAAVREVWVGEFRKFSSRPRRVLKGNSITDVSLWLKGRADVIVLSYERARLWQRHFEGDLFDALVLDEAHYLKTHDSQRTRALLGNKCDGAGGIGRWAAHVWFLTGTPMPNDPTDIWPFLHFCQATKLNLSPFTVRYFKSHTGAFSSRQTPRDEMVGELKQAIACCSLRRTKKEAGLQLPPIWLTTLALDGDRREILDLLRDWPGLEGAIMQAVEQGSLSFLDAQHIATLRRLVGEAKAPAYADLLAEELTNGKDKQVILGLHTRAAEMLMSALREKGFDGVSIQGSTSERARMDAVTRFQTDPACRWFYGQLKAAGTGITLTAGAAIDVFESSWAPADNAQGLMRVHRIGQTREVHARFISLSGSIDETVNDVVARKTAAIAQITGEAA